MSRFSYCELRYWSSEYSVTYLRPDLYLKPEIYYFCPFSGVNLAYKNVWGLYSVLLQKLNKSQHLKIEEISYFFRKVGAA